MTLEEKREWATTLRSINKTDMTVPSYRASVIRSVERLAAILDAEAENDVRDVREGAEASEGGQNG